MADFDVKVKVDPSNAVSGSDKVENALNRVEKRADTVGKMIKRALGFIGAYAGVRELIRTVDTFTSLQNRLRVVTTGTQNLTKTTEELYAIAQRTRSSFEGTVELYSRVALAAKDLGVQQSQLRQFTESLNQAIILSGASGAEAEAGLIQLSQGLASGALRGDELRSVLEQLPAVADVIAKELGVTRGQLRAMGAEGKITADIVLNAFKNARVELAERFNKTIPTISQSFQVLKNAVVNTIGGFDQATGASALFSKAILAIANNVDPLIRIIGALAFTIGTALAGQAIPKAIAAIKALTAAMAANPIGAILVALTAVIALLIAFSDKIQLSKNSLANLQDLAVAVWQEITIAVKAFVDYFTRNFGFILEFAKKIFGDVEFSVAGFVKFGASLVDRYIGIWITAFKAIKAVWDFFPSVLKEIAINAVNGMVSIVEGGVNKIINATNAIADSLHLPQIAEVELGKFQNTAEGASANIGKAIGQAIQDGANFSGVQDFVGKVFTRAEEIAKTRIAATEKVAQAEERIAAVRQAQDANFTKILEHYQKENALLKLSTQERLLQEEVLKAETKLKRDLTDAEKQLLESAIQENQALKIQTDLYDQIRGPVEQYKVTLAGLNELLKEGKISQQEMAAALQQTDLGAGLQGVKTSILPEETDTAALEALQEQYAQRQIIVEQARMAELLTQQEYNDLSLQLAQKYNDDVQRIEQARFQTQLAAGKTAFGALTGLAKTYAGEQSQTYRALFAISKGFAIAETTVAIAQGIANAIKLGWPAMIPAVAAVVAQSAGLIGQIQSANYSGAYQNGGSFTVGGSGGPDSQMVAFRASPNETVSVRTPGQERAAQAAAQPQTQTQPIQIVNVDDPGKLEDFMATPAGTKSVLNIIKKNPSVIKQFVQG